MTVPSNAPKLNTCFPSAEKQTDTGPVACILYILNSAADELAGFLYNNKYEKG